VRQIGDVTSNYDPVVDQIGIMPAVPDYYRILGLSSDADDEAVKRAYRVLARSCHPDCNPGDESATERFVLVQQAYRVLSHPKQRLMYDRRLSERASTYLHAFSSPGGPDRCQPPHRTSGRPAGAHTNAAQGADVTIVLSLEQALRGGHTEITDAAGVKRRVTIPRGCRDGVVVRLRARPAGASGDLFVRFRLRPHPRFRREGNHLHVIERISAVEAMLGTTRSIQSPYGRVIRLGVPPGTQHGHRFRLTGQGVNTGDRVGDLFVEIDVEVPKELTEEQRAELRQAATNLGLL
jgi:curved DNA-binding protein